MLDGTASGLRASIAEWLDDATLSASIPDFILMAEARMNRLLRIGDEEVRATATITGEYLPLPSDFGGMRSIFVSGSPNRPLQQMESGSLRTRFENVAGAAYPGYFAISGNQLQFGPVVASGNLEIVYYRRIPPLATNTTNWLLTAHPDVYLYGSLMAAEMRGWNDERLPMLKAAFDTGMMEIQIDSDRRKWGAAPVAPALDCIA